MPWVKLDDHFDEHPKVTAVGALGLALQVAALCWCARGLTDGHLPLRGARRLIDTDEYGIAIADVIDDLISHGLWHRPGHDCARCPHPSPGSFYIHDYLLLQPSREQHESRIEVNRANGRKGGRARAAGTDSPTNSLGESPSGSPSENPSPSPESHVPIPKSESRPSSPQPPAASRPPRRRANEEEEDDRPHGTTPTPDGTLRAALNDGAATPSGGWTALSWTGSALQHVNGHPDPAGQFAQVLAEHLTEHRDDPVGPKGIDALARLVQRYPPATVLAHLDRAISDPTVDSPSATPAPNLADKENPRSPPTPSAPTTPHSSSDGPSAAPCGPTPGASPPPTPPASPASAPTPSSSPRCAGPPPRSAPATSAATDATPSATPAAAGRSSPPPCATSPASSSGSRAAASAAARSTPTAISSPTPAITRPLSPPTPRAAADDRRTDPGRQDRPHRPGPPGLRLPRRVDGRPRPRTRRAPIRVAPRRPGPRRASVPWRPRVRTTPVLRQPHPDRLAYHLALHRLSQANLDAGRLDDNIVPAHWFRKPIVQTEDRILHEQYLQRDGAIKVGIGDLVVRTDIRVLRTVTLNEALAGIAVTRLVIDNIDAGRGLLDRAQELSTPSRPSRAAPTPS